MTVKVVAFNGSPRKGGNTEHLIEKVFARLSTHSIGCERIDIATGPLRGCTACYGCVRNQKHCVQKDDLNDWFEKARQADAIILGSPTYFANVSAEMKALIDRFGLLARVTGALNRKPLATVIAVRRGGAVPAFDALNRFGHICQMVIVGSTYWNLGFGKDKGEVTADEEAMTNMDNIGDNLAWLMQKLKD
jgi:multimeric flavodoxin WrbA